MKNLFLIFISLLGLSGCTSLGPRFTPVEKIPNDRATVYIYRVKKIEGSIASPYVCVDGKVVGELPVGSYFSFTVESGTHSIELRSLNMVGPSFDFTAVDGSQYFVRTDFSINNGMRESASAGAEVGKQSFIGGGGPTLAGLLGPEEKRAALAKLDTTAQTQSENPGFLAVQEKFALPEIETTKLFKVPAYSRNHCEHTPAEKELEKPSDTK